MNDVVDCYGFDDRKRRTSEIYVPRGNCLCRPKCYSLAIVSSHVDA